MTTPTGARRRSLLIWAGAGSVALAARQRARADDEPLDESEPGAVDLAYRADASRVDRLKNPSYQPGQRCANCALYAGEPGQAEGGCAVFLGKRVRAAGWCNAWDRKPA